MNIPFQSECIGIWIFKDFEILFFNTLLRIRFHDLYMRRSS